MSFQVVPAARGISTFFGQGLDEGWKRGDQRYDEQQKQNRQQQQQVKDSNLAKALMEESGGDPEKAAQLISSSSLSNEYKSGLFKYLELSDKLATSKGKRNFYNENSMDEGEAQPDQQPPPQQPPPSLRPSLNRQAQTAASLPKIPRGIMKPGAELAQAQQGAQEGVEDAPPQAQAPQAQPPQQKPQGLPHSPEKIMKAQQYDPNLAKLWQSQNDAARKQSIADRKEQVQFHKDTAEYDKKIRETADSANKELEVLEDALKQVESGNIKPTNIANIVAPFGKFGQALSDAFLNPNEANLKALTPELLHGKKEIFGVRLSDADLRVIMDKLPGIGKSPEANKAIIKIFQKYAKRSALKYEAAKAVKAEYGDLRPLGYEDKVEAQYAKMLKDVEGHQVRAPNGKIVKVPKDQLEAALQNGGQLVNE